MRITSLKTEYKSNPIGLETPSPRLFWKLEDERRNTVQTAYRIRCASSLAQLETEKNLLWDTGMVESDQSVHIEYHGPSLSSCQRVYWQVKVWANHGDESAWSEPAYWEMGLLNPGDWQAQWIASGVPEDVSDSAPSPFLRKNFTIEKEIASARVYASALGLYELSINGEKVGHEFFTPGWTAYQKRLQYQVFDVTNLLVRGENALGAILGDGWYRGYFVWQGNKNLYGEKIALMAQLKITYTDGSENVILSDGSWKSATGPILKSDIYNGETYDARLEIPAWDKPGFNDSAWVPVKTLTAPTASLVASEGSVVRITQVLHPIEKIITPKGELVFDMGQNMVGWIQFELKGNAGDLITIDHGEVLDQEGNFYNANLREAKAKDTYIFKGKTLETWRPRFTFHGFRYIRITGFNGEIDLENIEGQVLHSDMEKTGDFTCSDPLINQLQQNIDWGLRGNFLDIPTDCPQRDERLGWTGDAQVFASTAAFNRNTASFYTKWMKDLALEQKPDGSVPWVVPNVVKDGGGTGWSDGFGATGWADAAVVIPWEVYQAYGDIRILKNQYASMQAWVEYMIGHTGDRYIFDFGFHFGDWLAFSEYMSYHFNAPDYGYAGAYTEKELIATAYFYYSTTLMWKIATILGKNNDAERYAAILPKIKKAFQREFITETGRITSNSQTAYTLALSFGLYDETLHANGAQRLASDVKHFGHLTTGFLGTPLLCKALSENGYADLAYMLLFNKRYPSWLYPITRGATTIWERWDCIKSDGSFQTVGMNSFNHYAFGAIGNWLYTQVAGLQTDQDQPGYKHIVIRPLLTDQLNFAEARHHSLYGEVLSRWEQGGNKVSVKIEIPVNVRATVFLYENAGSITESGIPLPNHPSVSVLKSDNAETIVAIGSGKYCFEYVKL